MGGRIVDFRAPALADSKGFGIAAGEKHPTVRHLRNTPAIVGPGHRNAMPGAAAVVFGSFHRFVTCGVPAENGDFVARKHDKGNAPSGLQVRQPLKGNLLELRAGK